MGRTAKHLAASDGVARTTHVSRAKGKRRARRARKMRPLTYSEVQQMSWPMAMYPPLGFQWLPPMNRSAVPNESWAPVSSTAAANGHQSDELVRFDFDEHLGDCEGLGWPRFATRSHLIGSPWKHYFKAVYGEVPPRKAFPLCVSQLTRLYTRVLSELNISLPASAENACARDGVGVWRAWSKSKEPSWIVYLLHYKPPRSPLPADSWVEVAHRARSWHIGFERQGMWFQVSGGTGIWVNMYAIHRDYLAITAFHNECAANLRTAHH